MSAHDLMLPNVALRNALQDILRRLHQAERRQKFMSAAQFAQQSGTASIDDQNTGGGGWPVYTDIVTLPLDPGRWTVVSIVTFARTDDVTTTRARLRFSSGASNVDFVAQEIGLSGGAFGTTFTNALTLPGTVNFGLPITVTLSVAAGHAGTPAGADAVASNGAIVAWPS